MGRIRQGSRFATQEEFQEGLAIGQIRGMKFEGCGMPLMSTPEKMYMDSSEAHVIAVGSTGTGKSTLGAIPAIISMIACGESIIVTDLKGEIFQKTSGAAKKAGYKSIVLNWSNPTRSNHWNPCHTPYQIYHKGGIENQDESAMLLYDIAYSMCADPSARDRFWDLSSVDFTFGLLQGLIEDAKPDEVNMRSVALMGNMINERIGATSYLKEYFALKEPDSLAYIAASGTIDAPNDTRSSIVAVDRQAKRVFLSSEGLSRMLSGMDFSYEDLAKKKTIIYLIYPGETNVYLPIVSCFIGQAYCALVRIAKQQPNSRLPRRCNFVLDEFSNLTIKEFPNRISMGRGYNIRFLLFVQDIAQLQKKYSDAEMKTILSNCTTKIYYNVEDYELKQRLSNECGLIKVQAENGLWETRPLIAPYQLGMLRFGEALVFRRGVNFPFVTHLTPCYQMALPECNHHMPFPILPDEPVPVFDLKAFVKEKRRELTQSQNMKEAETSFKKPLSTLNDMPILHSAEAKLSSDFMDFNARIDAQIASMKIEESEQSKNDKESNNKKVSDKFSTNDELQLMLSLLSEDDEDTDAGEAFGGADEILWEFDDIAQTEYIWSSDDVIDLMKMDGIGDEKGDFKPLCFSEIAAKAFIADFEAGRMELSELLAFVLKLPEYAAYDDVREAVYNEISPNEENLSRLLQYIDSHDDLDAYKTLMKRFNLSRAQHRNLLNRAKVIFSKEIVEQLKAYMYDKNNES